MRGELLVGLVLVACERPPQPILICHNANCAGPVDSARDSTLAALDTSLALRRDGRPPFDGIELDLVWHAASGSCRFAHDGDAGGAAPVAQLAAERVADHLAREAWVTWRSEAFHLFVDLKPPDSAARLDHATCALDVAATVATGAAAGQHALEVVITSKSSALLAAVRAEPRFAVGLGPDVVLHLGGDLGIPRPLGGDTRPLADYDTALGLEVMGYNADFTTQAQHQAIRALELEPAQWMSTTTVETLDAIERYRPTYVLASEVPLLRAWLER